MRREFRFSTELDATLAGGLSPLFGSVLDKIAFELGKSSKSGEQVRSRPGITARELARRVNELFGLSVGRDAVWRFPKRCGPDFKKMTRVADERDWPDVMRRRERWKRHQGRIGPERLVFPDETCVKTNMAPLRGWGPKGERLAGPAPFSATGTLPPSSPPCATTGSTPPGCSTARSTARSS